MFLQSRAYLRCTRAHAVCVRLWSPNKASCLSVGGLYLLKHALWHAILACYALIILCGTVYQPQEVDWDRLSAQVLAR